MRIGLFGIVPNVPGASGDAPLDDLLDRVEQAEAAGFASFWAAGNSNLETLFVLALAGRRTSRIELGTAVVPTYPRHPVILAQQALTAQAATGNRFTLGIGLSHRFYIENSLGLDYSKPIRHTREYLSVLTPLLDGQTARFRGEEYRVSAQLNVPGATRPQILVAALGPQMLRLTGRLADGTITWMGGPKYLEQTAIPLIRQAASEAGRPTPRIAAGFPIVVTRDAENARAAVRKTFERYGTLPSYRAVLDVEGAPDPVGAAIIGDETSVGRHLRHLAGIGITDLLATPFEVEGDPAARRRTYEFLARYAKAGQ